MGKATTGKTTTGLRGRRRQNLTRLLSTIEDRLAKDSSKATLADFIRLTQLEHELEDEERPKEIVVRWVEPVEPQGSET
jgi:hypothetical protein